MALVKAITHQPLHVHTTHTLVECTYDIVQDATGKSPELRGKCPRARWLAQIFFIVVQNGSTDVAVLDRG